MIGHTGDLLIKRALFLALPFGLLVLGCANGRVGDDENARTGGAAAKLEASYDREQGALTVLLRNTGDTPLLIDKQLVFMLEIDVWDAEGNDAQVTERQRLPRPSDAELKNRFVQLEPGKSLQRRILLKGGFKVFQRAVASVFTEHGPLPSAIIAYEALCSLDEAVDPGRIRISFRRGLYFTECFSQYAGALLDPVHLYDGPLRVELALSDLD